MTCHICNTGIDANVSNMSPMRKSCDRTDSGFLDAHAICNARKA